MIPPTATAKSSCVSLTILGWVVNLSSFRNALTEELVAFAWDEWSQMGLSTTANRSSPWAQDPEALIVFTLEVARSEPRLFDELMDWVLVNESLLSVRRLRAVCIDEADTALTDAMLGWLANQRPRSRLRGRADRAAPTSEQALFRPAGPIHDADPSFARAGFMRPVLSPSHKSQAPDSSSPINLAFRLRQILGVGIRAEVVRILLTVDTPRVTAQSLSRASYYSKRNVHDALSGLSAAEVISTITVSGEQRYAADIPAWAALLHDTPENMPEHRDWPQLLGVLRRVLRWTAQPELETMSDYLLASGTRDLLEAIRPDLAFAGIAVNVEPPASGASRALEDAAEHVLVALRRPAAA